MKCCQCKRPALYRVGQDSNVPLCLHCYSIWKRDLDIDFLKNAMMMNVAMDNLDLTTGFSLTGDRMPVNALARALQGGHTLNNFNISESQIGVLNTGSINRIDAAITLSKGSDAELVGDQIKELTDAVVASAELTDEQKQAVLELTETLASEVVGKRKPATIRAIFNGIRGEVKDAGAVAAAAQKLWDLLSPLLQ